MSHKESIDKSLPNYVEINAFYFLPRDNIDLK